ncbi:MAG: protein kinase [Ruminococcus sp.]|nr:protein kinase [Ruminococcus sp.]
MSYCPYCMNEVPEGERICPSCGKDTGEYTSPSHTLARGAMLNHRFLVGGVLGEGGFGITYIGLDTLLQVRVAIKEFYPAGMVNRNNSVSNDVQSISADSARELFSKSREHFLHEARTLAKFTNEPGIVAVRDFFEENHTVYIVMEYLDGITLKSYLKQVGTISSYNTICLLMPVFRSLKKIHEKNLIHRDISPDNIMLVGEQVKLLDFGAAREFADEKSLSVMLKHGYAPMEQYRRHGKQGAWTDIYAICATVYKCITGTIPPDAPDRIYEDNLKMPSELGFEASPEFEQVLRHGLAIKAEDRIQSIDQLLRELAAVPDFDIDFSDGSSRSGEAPEQPVRDRVPSSSDKEDQRLSQYIPRDSYDSDSTVMPARPAAISETPSAPADNRDQRLSEYIPSSKPEPEEPPKKEKKPAAPVPEEKKKSKLPLIIGIAAAAAAAVGAVIFLLAGSGDSKPPVSSGDSSSVSEASSVTETTTTVTTAETVTSAPVSETEPVSSADVSETSSDTSGGDTSSQPHMHIIYPELGGNFEVKDGFLTMNTAVFSMKKASVELLVGNGTNYTTENHNCWIPGELVIAVPIDLGVYEEDYFDSIDLYFKGDALYQVQFENGSEYDQSVREKATEKYGEPIYENGDEIRWALKDQGCLFRIYMREYEGDKIFTQGYVYKDMAYEENMVESGFFD